MPFKTASIRTWAREWRQSDWRETIPLASGRECPRCLATVCGGRSWRAHDAWHNELDEWFAAVQVMATALQRAGMVTVSMPDEDGGEDQEDAALDGYVIGAGPLPEEMRGGGE